MPNRSDDTDERAVDSDPATVDDDETVSSNDSDEPGTEAIAAEGIRERARRWRPAGAQRVLVYGLLPGLALLLALTAGYLKWQSDVASASILARAQSVQSATEGTIAMLSYKPESVEKDLEAAQDRLTGQFRDSYNSLVHNMVIPGAKQQSVSAVATVPAAASMTASETHAVVIVFVDQTTTVGKNPPTSTASSVKVTLDKVESRWLISDFTPV